jgi:hypothetical protein
MITKFEELSEIFDTCRRNPVNPEGIELDAIGIMQLSWYAPVQCRVEKAGRLGLYPDLFKKLQASDHH